MVALYWKNPFFLGLSLGVLFFGIAWGLGVESSSFWMVNTLMLLLPLILFIEWPLTLGILLKHQFGQSSTSLVPHFRSKSILVGGVLFVGYLTLAFSITLRPNFLEAFSKGDALIGCSTVVFISVFALWVGYLSHLIGFITTLVVIVLLYMRTYVEITLPIQLILTPLLLLFLGNRLFSLIAYTKWCHAEMG